MYILLLTLYFVPDLAANAVIMSELAEALAALGHNVTAVAAFPHYDRNRVWDGYRGKLVQRDLHGAVRIYRTYLYVPQRKGRVFGRLLNYFSFNVLSTLVGLLAGPYDVILAPSPPLTIGLSAYILSRLRRVPYIYNVQDIYPDVAIRLGVLTNPRLIRFFRRMENFVYAKAAAVSVLSEGFGRNLLNKGVPGDKIHVFPNFVDVDFVRPLPRDNAFARRHDLHDKFVVMYAGNVGLSQGLETLLEAMQQFQDLPDLRLLIVGNGAVKAKLEAQASQVGLQNVIFLPFQPRKDVPEMYASADVSLVMLRQGIGAESVPSKAYTIMASKRPLVAAADKEAETKRLIDVAGCGLWVEPGNPSALAQAIRVLHADPARRAQLGRNGRDHVETHYTPQVVAQQYDALFKRIVG
jgi:colanic acid biosynthesis glycosyl transferase WcaI